MDASDSSISGIISSTENLMNEAGLFTEYLKHGNIWYIVIAHRKTGLVAGITRDAVVTIFSRIDLVLASEGPYSESF
ncbi:MAG: hypothetical protein FGF48_01650 [Candidatus Brockarchaeota archaeon]|nr:hypothetical protein [Candidatus Brockarchaeota archaeon]